MLRLGHTFRIYDCLKFETNSNPETTYRFTLVLDPEGKGGCYYPRIALHWRYVSPKHKNCVGNPYVVTRTIRFTVPHISFAKGYKYRHVGGLFLYKAFSAQYLPCV
jgi:hypothetical protein